MNFRSFVAVTLMAHLVSCGNTDNFRFEESESRVALYYQDQLITSYIFEDSLRKQVFYPLNLPSGKSFVRGYPIDPKEGEPTDHPHHIGIWYTYGEVNGIDFWTSNWENYDGVNPRFGKIRHEEIQPKVLDSRRAEFVTRSSWKNSDDETLLNEASKTQFTILKGQIIIDRVTKLSAEKEIHFEDSKEGMYAIRVPSELQQDQTGQYENSEGLKGDEVWGQKAAWVILRGEIDGKPASVLFMDHPDNTGYPTHWMARGYGLFAANPLGQAVYTNSTDSLNLHIDAGEAITFKYRIVLSDREVSDDEINQLAKDFNNQ